jgi:hypothetical protein
MRLNRHAFVAPLFFSLGLAACNSVEPYPASWHAAGTWEAMYTSIRMESRYAAGTRAPMVATPAVSAFSVGVIPIVIMHTAGSTSADYDATPGTIDPTTGQGQATLVQPALMLTPNCEARTRIEYDFDFSRDRLSGTMLARATIDLVDVGLGATCATYLQGVADYFLTNSGFPPPGLWDLATWTYGGALDISALANLKQLYLEIEASMVNTTPAQDRDGEVLVEGAIDQLNAGVAGWVAQLAGQR